MRAIAPRLPCPCTLAALVALALAGCPKARVGGSTSITIATSGSSSGGTDTDGLDGGRISVQPASLDFGNVQVGTSSTLSLTLANLGSGTSDPISFSPVSGPQASDFGWTGTPTALGPNQSFTLQVTFEPTVQGQSSAVIPYQFCAGCRSASLPLTGVGVDGQLAYSPTSVTFSNVPVGSTVSSGITLTNVGSAAVQIGSSGAPVLILDTPSTVYTLTGLAAGPVTLQPLESTTFEVSYTPATADPPDQVDAVWVPLDASGKPVAGISPRVAPDPISATVAPCTLTIKPPPVYFGCVSPGSVQIDTVTLTDTGDVACPVSAILLDAGVGTGFALGATQATAFTVEPGSSQQITVIFSPHASTSPLADSAQLTFQTGDANAPSASFPLSGTTQVPYCGFPGGWPKWHQDNFNSGQSPANTAALQGAVAWKFKLGVPGGGRTYINSPVISVASGIGPPYVIYQMDMQGGLHGLANTGVQVVNATLSGLLGDPQPATPAVLFDGSLVIATGTAGNPANLYYLTGTGVVISSEAFGGAGFDSCPALAQDGKLFLADGHGESTACGGADGGDPYAALAFVPFPNNLAQVAGLALPFPTVARSFGVALAEDDTSYWGNDGTFFAVSPPSPDAGFTPVAAWPACGVTLTPPGVNAVSNLAFDISTTGNLYAYSAWETASPDGGYTVQGNIAALDPATGAQLWIFDIPAATLPAGWTPLQSDVGNASPAVSAADGTVYVGGGLGLYALTGATGAQQWLFPSANVSSSPAIGGDGTIFFGCDDGNFYAVTPAGQQRFIIPAGGPISSSPAIAPDGTVYFVSDDGNLYAIQ